MEQDAQGLRFDDWIPIRQARLRARTRKRCNHVEQFLSEPHRLYILIFKTEVSDNSDLLALKCLPLTLLMRETSATIAAGTDSNIVMIATALMASKRLLSDEEIVAANSVGNAELFGVWRAR